ncbi:MAG: tRNA (guanosine(37)-N1)-methyltransferase TrmD [Candidatus Aminicenantes bacterium]|nr:tRNA (guanosine(37)-N1)-methyltransferase TrmD [Candidatus Aminicenantes bacterium]
MRFDIITIFPEMFGGFLGAGILKKAADKGLVDIRVHDLREQAEGKHRQVDDRPFGGGEGMVLMPGPVCKAVEAVRETAETPVVLLSPLGRMFTVDMAQAWAGCRQVILICGRYEGVDERVGLHLATVEVSIGDYVLTGGEPADMVVIDAVARFVPGVVGKAGSVAHDSFAEGLLDCPHYTRPRVFRGHGVPEVLLSGDHARIERWRRRQALAKTLALRPDLLIGDRPLSAEDRVLLDEIRKERKES